MGGEASHSFLSVLACGVLTSSVTAGSVDLSSVDSIEITCGSELVKSLPSSAAKDAEASALDGDAGALPAEAGASPSGSDAALAFALVLDLMPLVIAFFFGTTEATNFSGNGGSAC